jgi:hypothetical protein
MLLRICVAALIATAASPRAHAAEPPAASTIHPIFSAVPDVPRAEEARQRFAVAVARHNLGPVETMDAPSPAAPRAAELLATGRKAVETKRFDEAQAALDAAVAEVLASGADGLEPAQLADLFLYQGMAAQKADWKDLPQPLTEIVPPKAKEAYLRAAVLAPDRTLIPRLFPPLAVESWKLATAEVARRPRGSVLVRAPSSALISIDGGPLRPGLSPASNLIYGDHFIRVEDPGRQRWAAVVPLALPVLEIDVPAPPALTLADADAAAHARRQGAVFALVAELGPGLPARLEVRLIEAQTGVRRDATTLAFPGEGTAVDAAVARLEQRARQARFGQEQGAPAEPGRIQDIAVAPVPAAPPAGPRIGHDPAGWARQNWPAVTAVGVALAAVLVLGVLTARSDGR